MPFRLWSSALRFVKVPERPSRFPIALARRPRRFQADLRPGFMTVVVAGALLVAPAFGVLAEHLHDEQVVAAARARELDQRVRADIIGMGWQPLDHTGLEPAHVELLVAKRSFDLRLGNGPLTGNQPDPALVARARQIISSELDRYPRSFLEQSQLRRVLLCQSLHERGQAIPSLPNYASSLLLDVDAPASYLKRLLHHEVYHFVDFADDEQLSQDPEWEALNDRWFVYGSGGRFMRDPDSARFTDRIPGFVSKYATSAVEEDKAEVFALMMVEPETLERMAMRDPVVANKLRAIERRIALFSPELGAQLR